MFDWDHARTFLVVVEQGSFSGAARRLRRTQPTVSRQITAFEEKLNVTLFERTGRELLITDAGMKMLDHVRAMEAQAAAIELAASGHAHDVDGQVRVTASEFMAAHILPQLLEPLRDSAPKLEIDVIADNGLRDLARREADIAIRHGEPRAPKLVTRPLRSEVMRFYASPAYLKRFGVPDRRAFGAHQIVSFVEPDQMLEYLEPAGFRLARANFRFTSSSQLAAMEMARAGLGMMVLPDSVITGDPAFVPVFDEDARFYLPTWLVTHREVYTSRRIRVVFDLLEEALRER